MEEGHDRRRELDVLVKPRTRLDAEGIRMEQEEDKSEIN